MFRTLVLRWSKRESDSKRGEFILSERELSSHEKRGG